MTASAPPPEDVLVGGGVEAAAGPGSAYDRPRTVRRRLPRLTALSQLATAAVLGLGVVTGLVALRHSTPAAPHLPAPHRAAQLSFPYYPPPPRLPIPAGRAVPHTAGLVGGQLPATGRGPAEIAAFRAMAAVLDHYCAHRGAGARSLRLLDGYRHVVAVANPASAPQIDIELWWTGRAYRWQAARSRLDACS
ncbi:MAG: hypothetical protein M3042_04525 [Actinomycetota bacterium]|nr:hypothetical protein [Actinomycetota bacterium]